MQNFINSLIVKGRTAVEGFFKKEDGDTNFISILVVLAIAMALAAAFIGFKDQIIGWVERTMPSFFTE